MKIERVFFFFNTFCPICVPGCVVVRTVSDHNRSEIVSQSTTPRSETQNRDSPKSHKMSREVFRKCLDW